MYNKIYDTNKNTMHNKVYQNTDNTKSKGNNIVFLFQSIMQEQCKYNITRYKSVRWVSISKLVCVSQDEGYTVLVVSRSSECVYIHAAWTHRLFIPVENWQQYSNNSDTNL